MNKDSLLKSLDYLMDRKPSQWDLAFIVRIKKNLIPDLITYIRDEKFEKNIMEEAKNIFNTDGLNKSNETSQSDR